MSPRVDWLFPRDPSGRIALALASTFFEPISWSLIVALGIGARPGRGPLERLLWLIIEELFLGLSLFFACGLIGTLATPLRVETMLESVAKKLALAMGRSLVPLAILVAWALLIS